MDDKHVHNLNVLLMAISNNDMALLHCSDAITGQPAPVICVMSSTDKPGEVAVIPVARMFVGNPLDQVKMPDDLAEVIKEHARLKLAVAAMEAAEAEPVAPAAGGLH